MERTAGRDVTRRGYLGAVGAALGSLSLAGCSSVVGDGTPTATRTPQCAGETDAPSQYDDWLAQPAPDAFGDPNLLFATAAPAYLSEFAEFWPVARQFLQYAGTVAGTVAVPLAEAERVSYLRPPPSSPAAYVAFRHPADESARAAWLNRIRIGIRENGPDLQARELTEVDPYGGFTRYHVVNSESADLLGYDDETVVAVPSAAEAVQADAQERFERLVDTRADDAHPAHCYRPALRALLSRVNPAALARVWFRADEGTFDGGSNRAPEGARARIFAVTPRGPERDFPPSDGESAATDTAASAGTGTGTSSSTATETSTATTTETPVETPSEPVVDLRLAVAYRSGEADAAAVRQFVDEHWLVEGGRGGLGFAEPSIERDGQVVIAVETRSLASITGE